MTSKSTLAESGQATAQVVSVASANLYVASMVLCLVASCKGLAQSSVYTCTIQGAVVVMDSRGTSYVSGAKVVLQGRKTSQTETDENGRYSFHGIEPGKYNLAASFPGLQAAQEITIQRDTDNKVELKLKPVPVTSSVTVDGANSDEKVSTITEKTIVNAPNVNDQFQNLLPMIPGVVRGPDGHINMKGARNTQSGALVNSANVTDPATGSAAINLPIDVVSSVQVISNPYDPQYGKLTGAVSTVETKTSDYERYHFTIQNIVPRLRDRDGSIVGIGAATPRVTFTGPILKDRAAFTQSFEYRFLRTPVNSLPPLQRDQKLEGFNSYTQLDLIVSSKQTATVSMAIYPQKLGYMGLNTFTPQPSTADFHQRGYQLDAQDRYFTGSDSALVSQINYKTYDTDVTTHNNEPYELLIDTTEGGFFNRQSRRTSRFEWQESYQFAPHKFLGTHQSKAGVDYAHSSFNGTETFLPVTLIGSSGLAIERINFTHSTSFGINQNEMASYVADRWSPSNRLTFDFGMRLDVDSVTSSAHLAPRGDVVLALTSDDKTLLKTGAGIFYDRVPLMLPVFKEMPDRTVSMLDSAGQATSSTPYVNRIMGKLQNPRSTSWNAELERRITQSLTVRVGYEQRNTARNFVVSSITGIQSGAIALSNVGSDSYREFQVGGRYTHPRFTLNGSYVHSRAYGNLNDPFLFFGNYPQAVIQPDARGRLGFDAPNRFLFWGDITGPWKLTFSPVYDTHTGFPYSVQDDYRDYIGPRNTDRFPRFSSLDLQVTRPLALHLGERRIRARVGFAAFNALNHFNPRDVQTVINSSNFGGLYNDAWREFRGKLVFGF